MPDTRTNFAARIHAHGGPQQQLPMPAPGSDQVRIQGEASSLVFTDLLLRRNLYPMHKTALPFTLGYSFIGRVDAVGSDVTQWQVGDRVPDLTQFGANAHFILLFPSS